MFSKQKKIKNIAWFFQNYGGIHRKIDEVSFELNPENQFEYRGKAYTLLYKECIFTNKKGQMIYFFDYMLGQWTIHEPSFENVEEGLLAFIDDVCNRHITEDILKASKQKLSWKDLILYIIGFLGCGFAIGLPLGLLFKMQGWL